MSLIERLFGSVFTRSRRLVTGPAPHELPQAVVLSDVEAPLTHLASLLLGRPVKLQAVEGVGGWQRASVLLPGVMALAPTADENLRWLVARLAYTMSAATLGFAAPPDATEVSRFMGSVLAFRLTRRHLETQAPGVTDAFDALVTACSLARPAASVRQRLLEALSFTVLDPSYRGDLQLSEVERAWVRSTAERPVASIEGVWPAVAEALSRAPLPRLEAPPGWLCLGLPLSPSSAPAAAVSTASVPRDALPTGSERKAPRSQETVEVIEAPRDQLNENPLTHSFEKVHTAEEYRGGSKRIDGADELAAHGAALDELDLRQVIRSGRSAGSVYHVDAPLEASAADLEGSPGAGIAYPEWDEARRAHRPDWCRVFLTQAPRAPDGAPWASELTRRHRSQVEGLQAVFERLRASRAWADRQSDGAEVDIAAVVDRHASMRAGHEGSQRLYLSKERRRPEVSVLFLLDASMSTDGWVGGRRVLDVEKEALVLLTAATQRVLPRVGIAAFHSYTRRECRFITIKSFEASWAEGMARLHGLKPEGYTRVGPALRHATRLLSQAPARRRVVVLLSDGKATDLDRYEGRYGIADVAQAVREARHQQVDVFAVAVDPSARKQLPTMFGHGRHSVVTSPAGLVPAVARLCSLVM